MSQCHDGQHDGVPLSCFCRWPKSADALQAALSQARTLFPFPLLGIDTDSGSEFLNEQVIVYCEQEHLTFTRGRSGVKNDQAHVEQKNRAVVREAVGCVRLVGVRAYQQLGEVYRALRLVVNCFQPSFKLQTKVLQGERVRRVYDVAQTPLQRALASGALSEERQGDLREQVQQIDPLALSEHLDALRYALLCEAHLPPTMGAFASAQIPLRFCLAACTPGVRPMPEGAREQTGSHDVHANREEILAQFQAHPEWTSPQIVQEIEHRVPARAIAESSSSEETVSDADLCATQAPPFPARSFGTASRTVGEHESGDSLMTVE